MISANSAQIDHFWHNQVSRIENLHPKSHEFKGPHSLPLARIKKIMKLDEDGVKMISADAPVVLAKACEIFILELTLKAWTHTESSRRRTLQRNDVSKAVSQSEMCDFLIDIVPRDDSKTDTKVGSSVGNVGLGSSGDGSSAAITGGYGMMTQEQMEQYMAMQQRFMEMYQQAMTSPDAGGGAQMPNTTPQMMQYASQFQMPQMDAETAATYAQYYQQYYMQMAEAGAQMAQNSPQHNHASESNASSNEHLL